MDYLVYTLRQYYVLQTNKSDMVSKNQKKIAN